MTDGPGPCAADEMLQRCFYYPAVGQTVQVLSEDRSATFEAVVTAAPAEQIGMWSVRPLASSTGMRAEQQRVHFSRLASRWSAPPAAPSATVKAAATDGRPTHAPVTEPGSDSRPLVVVVGAGLGGLAAAAAMQRWGARVQVYERDRRFDERKQGYGLTMQQGKAALRALGAESLALDCVTATLHVSFASDGTPLGRYGYDTRCVAEQAETDSSSRDSKRRRKRNRNFLIARQQLRQELLDLLEPGTVRWGRRFKSYEQLVAARETTSSDGAGPARTKDGVITVRFSRVEDSIGGTTGDVPESAVPPDRESIVEINAAVLVGADGIFSRVAKQRMAAEHTSLVYTGVLVVLGIVDFVTDSPGSGAQRLRDHELLRTGTTVSETVDGNTRFCKSARVTDVFKHSKNIYLTTIFNVVCAADMMPFSPTQQMWQLSLPMPLDRAKALQHAGPVALHRESLQLCGDWHEPLPALITLTLPENVTGYPVPIPTATATMH